MQNEQQNCWSRPCKSAVKLLQSHHRYIVKNKKKRTTWCVFLILLVVCKPLVDNFHKFAFEHNCVCAVVFRSDKTQRWIHNTPPVVTSCTTQLDDEGIVHTLWQSYAIVASVGKLFLAKLDICRVAKAVALESFVAHVLDIVELFVHNLHGLGFGCGICKMWRKVVYDGIFDKVFDILVGLIVAVRTDMYAQKLRVGLGWCA